MVSFILPGNSATGGYEVANSLRVDRNSSAYLTRTENQDQSDGKKITISVWFKLGAQLGSTRYFFGGHADGSYTNEIGITSNDQLNFSCIANGTNQVTTNRVFRDTSAWFHVVAVLDSTQGTDTNRIKLYVNGVQETSFASSSYPSQNAVTEYLKNGGVTRVGDKGSGGNNFDGYLAEVCVLDGQALDPTSFGEFDEDSPTIWKPIDVSDLTFGNNGFYLDFEDSSNLGNDANGGTDFTANNLAATDQSTDTCTNNYATFNPLDNYYLSGTFTEGNLKISIDNNSTEAFTTSTIGVSSGKWYMENKIITTSSGRLYSGVTYGTAQATNDWPGGGSDQWFYRSEDGKVYNGGSLAYTGATLADGDIVGIALDLDNHKLYFSKNGTFNNSGDPTSGSTGTGAIALDTGQTYFFAVGESGSTAVVSSANFGSPEFSISSGNSDGRGYGNFEYAVPSGYYALNTKNLAEFG